MGLLVAHYARPHTEILTVPAATNYAVQQSLRSKGEIGAEARTLTVLDRVSITREGARQIRAYQEGRVVEFNTNLPSQDFARGERGVVVAQEGNIITLHMGDGLLKDLEPGRLAKNLGHDAVSIFQEKQIALHEGDRLRWTTNDADRGLLNNQLAEVRSMTRDAVTIGTADGATHDLKDGDRMLERLDLAYALTVHAAQGMTAENGILVLREEERQLNSTRSFLVAATRVTDSLTLVVDNARSIERGVAQNPGGKASALDIAESALVQPDAAFPERFRELIPSVRDADSRGGFPKRRNYESMSSGWRALSWVQRLDCETTLMQRA